MSKNIAEVKNVDIVNKPVKKKVNFVLDAMNSHVRNFLSGTKLLEDWDNIEHQNNLINFIKENKIKMPNPNAEIIKMEKKLEKKNKIIEREKNKQIIKVQKSQEKIKSPFFFYKNEEEIIIKNDNPTFNKKDIHNELQKKWKMLKQSINDTDKDRVNRYIKLSNEDAENKKILPTQISYASKNIKNKDKYKPKKEKILENKYLPPIKEKISEEKSIIQQKPRFIDYRIKYINI